MKIELSPSQPAKARWMVVDDNEGILEFMAAMLERMNCAEVIRFHLATEALTAFASTPEQFKFVVADCEMPDMNGVDFCRLALALSPGAKVLPVTASDAINKDKARALGFCGWLPKPFSAAALWRAVAAAEILSRRKTIFSNQKAASLAA